MGSVTRTVQIRESCSPNLKMAGSGIAECPEIEQMRRCPYFGSGLCPSCYSEFLYRLREGGRKWREERGVHSHRTTSSRGVIRLGTYIEVSPSLWLQYKQGRGTWDCCGQTWSRPDFRTRPYFLVTRGLYSEEFYQQVLEDPALTALHVSVDITDRVIPDIGRLTWFSRQNKTLFRIKTRPQNVEQFAGLIEELGVEPWRIIEMPLRIAGRPFAYSHRTPLEQLGWDLTTFGRCNTHCRDCQRENGIRLCTASYETLRGFRFNPNPPRQAVEPKPIPWRGAMRLCLQEYGTTADLEQVYGWFSRKYPWLPNKPSWKFRIRVTIQQVAVNVGKGKWRL